MGRQSARADARYESIRRAAPASGLAIFRSAAADHSIRRQGWIRRRRVERHEGREDARRHLQRHRRSRTILDLMTTPACRTCSDHWSGIALHAASCRRPESWCIRLPATSPKSCSARHNGHAGDSAPNDVAPSSSRIRCCSSQARCAACAAVPRRRKRRRRKAPRREQPPGQPAGRLAAKAPVRAAANLKRRAGPWRAPRPNRPGIPAEATEQAEATKAPDAPKSRAAVQWSRQRGCNEAQPSRLRGKPQAGETRGSGSRGGRQVARELQRHRCVSRKRSGFMSAGMRAVWKVRSRSPIRPSHGTHVFTALPPFDRPAKLRWSVAHCGGQHGGTAEPKTAARK